MAEHPPAVVVRVEPLAVLDLFDLPARLRLERQFWALARRLLALGQSVVLESSFWSRGA